MLIVCVPIRFLFQFGRTVETSSSRNASQSNCVIRLIDMPYPLRADELYRPAQNSSGRYGYGMSINRITQLDRQTFREEEVSTVLPNWNKNLIGTHTISMAGDLTVIDCLVKRSRWS